MTHLNALLLLLTLGARFDHLRLKLDDRAPGIPTLRPKFDAWSPKAALTWRIAPPLAAYVSYARGLRLPNRPTPGPSPEGEGLNGLCRRFSPTPPAPAARRWRASVRPYRYPRYAAG